MKKFCKHCGSNLKKKADDLSLVEGLSEAPHDWKRKTIKEIILNLSGTMNVGETLERRNYIVTDTGSTVRSGDVDYPILEIEDKKTGKVYRGYIDYTYTDEYTGAPFVEVFVV